MSQYFQIHPHDPQRRLLRRAVDIIHAGGVAVYPTDSCYALGCLIGDKGALERIRRIRQTGKDHNFTLVCNDLSEISVYARLDNADYRLLRALTPGPYTFILRAGSQVPKRLLNPRRRTIGIRVPDHAICRGLLAELGAPIMSSTLILPGDEMPLNDPDVIRERLEHQVDVIIDGGNCGLEPTSVVDLMTDTPTVVRAGRGDISMFQR